MSERIEKIADEILAVVNKKRTSGKTPENDVWVATYLPNRQEIAVIFGDREVSNSYVQHRFKKDDRASIISTLEKLYGAEPRNHNEQQLDESQPIVSNPYRTGDTLTDYIKSTMWRPEDEEKIDEDTVYDHSWYEVEDGDYPKRTKDGVEIKEMASGGCTTAGCVAENSKTCSVTKTIKSLGKPSKRKHKKVSDDLDATLFKESILNDMPCVTEIENHTFKYFMNEGKWYMGVDNCLVKTHDKNVMMETFDQIVDEMPVTTSLLEDYSCYEMDLLMEEENTDTYPGDTENPMTNLGNQTTDNLDMNDNMTALSAIAYKLEKNAKDDNPTEQPETSEQIADKQKHLDDLNAAKNQEVNIIKNGESTSAINNGTIKTAAKDDTGNDITLVGVTHKNGEKSYERPEDVNLEKETLE